MDNLERILDRLRKHPTRGCWIWSGAPTGSGYGQVSHEGRVRLVHRILYEAVFGTLPDGLEVDHLCYVPLCARPSHLQAVTRRENLARRRARGSRNSQEYVEILRALEVGSKVVEDDLAADISSISREQAEQRYLAAQTPDINSTNRPDYYYEVKTLEATLKEAYGKPLSKDEKASVKLGKGSG